MPTLLIRGRHVGKNMKRGKFEGAGGMREKTGERGKKNEKGELTEEINAKQGNQGQKAR